MLHCVGQTSDAVRLCRSVAVIDPACHAALRLLSGWTLQEGRTEAGIRLVGRALAVDRSHVEPHYNLALAHISTGHPGRSIASLRRLLALDPQYWPGYHHLANAFASIEDLAAAVRGYGFALAFAPEAAEIHGSAANALLRIGRYAAAMSGYRRALVLDPAGGDTLNNLGHTLMQIGRLTAAVDVLQRALAASGPSPAIYDNLGFSYARLQQAEPAFTFLKRALVLEPDSFDISNNLGTALMLANQSDRSIVHYRRGLAIRPDDRDVHSNLIFILDHALNAGMEEHQAERKRWDERHGKRWAPSHPVRPRDADPDRRLRIGYVSADFRHHSAASVFGPAVLNHDRSRIQVLMYSGTVVEDDRTDRFKAAADIWRSTLGVSDDDLAARVREDHVDILVDLSGHTLGHRLPVFARKPAPVQVTAWGHVTGTGLSAIDYFFADPVLVPAEMRHLLAETVYDLPCVIYFDPPGHAPEVAPRPSAAGAPFTYGCLNRITKLSEPTLDLWGEILRRRPDARLLLKDSGFDTLAARERMLSAFRARGIESSRVILRGGTPQAAHLATFGEIDVALDPFPQNGGVSTLEALWMGVPVVSLLGTTLVGRIAGAALSGVGYAEWAVPSKRDYVDLALGFADAPDALDRSRRMLRAEMKTTHVGDPISYSRATEAAYREIWRRACERDARR